MSLPLCPKCNESYTYQEGHLFICPMCLKAEEEALIIRDINGNPIVDGDNAVIAMDLKLGKDTIKQGTKVKGIQRLDDPVDGHNIQGKVDGFGSLLLKSSVIKK